VSNRPSRRSSSAQRVRTASNSGKSSTIWIWVGLAVLIVVVGVVAIAVGRSSSSGSDDGGSATGSGGTVVPNGNPDPVTVTVEGQNLPQASTGSGGADAAAGMTIPTINGETFDGSPVVIAPGGGKGQVIMVVAHWCPHCRAEVPRVQSWLDESGMPSDVNLTAIATANDPTAVNYPAGDWLRREGWSVPTMLDDEQQTAALAVGTSAYPFFVVVDSDGKVVERQSGEITEDQWNALLDAARTGQAASA
jgi:thiol-disulfide isomerase/thioredoxin